MEATSGKETITVLRCLIAYAEEIFQLSKDIVTQIFQTYSPGPKCGPRCAWFVRWRTYTVRRELDKQDDPQQSDWIWVTTLPLALVPVARIVHLGHQRWDIENYGFNELVKHDPGAIECFLLVAFLAYNIFSCFPGAQCEASRAPGQGRNLLGQAHRCGTLQLR